MGDDWEDGEQTLKQIADTARDAAREDQIAREKVGRSLIEEQGIRVGDVVEITWTRDRRYGNEDGRHVGEVEYLESGFIYVQSGMRAVGRLHMPISGIRSIRVVERDGAAVEVVPDPPVVFTAELSANPFISQQDQQTNPFL